MKKCTKCGEEKPQSQFRFNTCKPCGNRRSTIRKKYGLSWDDYIALKKQQDNKCGVCKQELSEKTQIDVDHSHSSGKVRGLLCHRCNVGLGFFKDDLEYLESAVNYLKKYN